jgi:tetratricopeptide (TPR) repeat protein
LAKSFHANNSKRNCQFIHPEVKSKTLNPFTQLGKVLILCALFVFCSCISFSPAAADTWQQVYDEADAAFNRGDMTTAKEKCEEALKLADQAREIEPGMVTCFTKLALVNDRLGNTGEAERLYELAMRTLEGQAGRESLRFADFMPDLGYMYQAHHKSAKAEVLFKKAVEIKEKALGQNDSRVADAWDDYAHFLEKENRHVEAAECSQRSRTIRSKL